MRKATPAKPSAPSPLTARLVRKVIAEELKKIKTPWWNSALTVAVVGSIVGGLYALVTTQLQIKATKRAADYQRKLDVILSFAENGYKCGIIGENYKLARVRYVYLDLPGYDVDRNLIRLNETPGQKDLRIKLRDTQRAVYWEQFRSFADPSAKFDASKTAAKSIFKDEGVAPALQAAEDALAALTSVRYAEPKDLGPNTGSVVTGTNLNILGKADTFQRATEKAVNEMQAEIKKPPSFRQWLSDLLEL